MGAGWISGLTGHGCSRCSAAALVAVVILWPMSACGGAQQKARGSTAPSPASPASPSPSGPTDPNGIPLAEWPDACQLLNGNDATSAVGETFGAAKPQQGQVGSVTLPLPPRCGYSSTNVDVTLTIVNISDSVASARSYFQTSKTIGRQNPVTVPVGDEAFSSGGPLGRTDVRVGRVQFVVEIDWPGHDQQAETVSAQLARVVVPRLSAASVAARG
jgi:hypothetical protein